MNAPCLVSLVTPGGRGAVATLIVLGDDATSRVAAWFQAAAGKSLTALPRDRILFGRWRTEESAGEELVVCPRGRWIEIHCHGGLAASRAVIATLVADGCQEVSWTELAWRMGGDEITVEARVALAEARTERTAAILLDQLRGALRMEWERIAALITRGALEEAATSLEELLARSRVGLHLTDPFRVVLCGEPNVGKSSLINALLGYQRAVVFDQPGTTRDVVTAYTALDGWPVELADTAGLRVTSDALEFAAIDVARQRLRAADLVVLVLDASRGSPVKEDRLNAAWPEGLVVSNKSDLVTSHDRTAGLYTSAVTGQGIANVAEAIIQRLVGNPPAPGEPIPFTARQVEELRQALCTLRAGSETQSPAQMASPRERH